MKHTLYQIDAFAKQAFQGNPAAICPLQEWPDDSVLLAIAEENNLSETAYFIEAQEGFRMYTLYTNGLNEKNYRKKELKWT